MDDMLQQLHIAEEELRKKQESADQDMMMAGMVRPLKKKSFIFIDTLLTPPVQVMLHVFCMNVKDQHLGVHLSL